jgi:transcriptional antiterminator RfaH
MADANTAWYVVHTQPNAERKAADHLARQGFATYLPSYLKKRRHARKVETVRAPFFPRYLFVAVDVSTQRWRAINSTVGVSRLIAREDTPIPVMRGVVEELKRREDGDGLLRFEPQATQFKAGDVVRVASGALKACCGLFEAISDRERVAILLDLMGRKVRVVLTADSLESA